MARAPPSRARPCRRRRCRAPRGGSARTPSLLYRPLYSANVGVTVVQSNEPAPVNANAWAGGPGFFALGAGLRFAITPRADGGAAVQPRLRTGGDPAVAEPRDRDRLRLLALSRGRGPPRSRSDPLAEGAGAGRRCGRTSRSRVRRRRRARGGRRGRGRAPGASWSRRPPRTSAESRKRYTSPSASEKVSPRPAALRPSRGAPRGPSTPSTRCTLGPPPARRAASPTAR